MEEQMVEEKENKQTGDNSLNYKVDTYKMDFNSKKVKNILIICFIVFIIIVCLSSLKGCSKNNTSITDIVSSNSYKETNGVSSGVSKVYDAVIYISSYNSNKKRSSGTGFVYKKEKGKIYALTNYHIVNASDTFKVVLSNGKTVTGKYLGGDKYLDIAVISIPSSSNVKVVSFKKSSDVPLGGEVFTIGSPVGDEYQGTVTKGILSGKNRMVSVSVSGSRKDYIMKVLQTDAAMSPGSSGGPLCTAKGEVIGINSMKFADNDIEGMAFATSIEDIEKHLSTFEEGKSLKRPYLGLSMLNMSEKDSLRSNSLTSLANSSNENGIAVVAVKAESPCYRKLRRGDVIKKVNGTSTQDIAHFRYEVFKHKPGDIISITVDRNGSSKSIKTTLK